MSSAGARGAELERGFAFGVVRQLFEPLLTRRADDPDSLLTGAARLAAPLFPTLGSEELPDAADAPHAVLHGLYWLTVNASAQRPLLLCIDDAHWSDGASLRAISYLANRMTSLPLLIVIATRPFEPGAENDLLDEIAAHPSAQVVRPRPLTEDAVGRVLGETFGRSADPEFAKACWVVTKGNPFFLREVVVELDADGIEPSAEQASSVVRIAPRTLARSVERRIDRLPAAARALAGALAVLGDGASLALAAALAEIPEENALAAADALRRVDLLAEGQLEFVHPVVRSVIYAGLPGGSTPAAHARAARLLADQGAPDAAVAGHIMAATPAGDAWAVEILRRLAADASAQGAPDSAAQYLQRALAEPPAATLRQKILLELGLAETYSAGKGGFRRFVDALEASDDPGERAEIALEFARVLLSHAEFGRAAEVLEQARVDIADTEDGLAARLDAWLLSAGFWDLDVYGRLSERLAELVDAAATADDPVLLATASAFEVTRHEPAARGARLARRALAGGELSISEMPVLFAAASTLLVADRAEEAVRVWDAAIAEARRGAALPALGFGLSARAHCLLRLGRIAAVEADTRHVLDLLREQGALYASAAIPPLIDALCERGELEVASGLLDGLDISSALPSIMPINYLFDSAARLRLAQGRGEEAVGLLRECGRRLDDWGVRNPAVIAWRSQLALALAGIGQHDEAIALAHEEVELARRFELPRALGIALRSAALVENSPASVELLVEAVATLEQTPAALEHARALTDLGALLRRRGQRTSAREPLRKGLDLARRCGATALAQRAHAELVAAGARPRRLTMSGVDALTPSERRVAEHATRGLTNREIAQTLFITEKTVEGHLRLAYRKLDINSRSELPAYLSREKQGQTPGAAPLAEDRLAPDPDASASE